jgi:DNA polymerase-3 subunit alpha
MKIDLLPPDINNSDVEFTIEKDDGNILLGKIRFGLSAVKNVGSAAIASILGAREKEGSFKSFTDFVRRVDLSKVNRKTLESLIKVGAFDKFGRRAALLASYSSIVEKVSLGHKKRDENQVSLFAIDENIEITDNLPDIEELSKQELLQFEKSLLGLYLTEHPLTPYLPALEKKVTHKISQLSSGVRTSSVIAGGIVTQVKKIFTKTGNSEMAFVKIDDFTGVIELVVFPTVFQKTINIWLNDRIILAKGKLSQRDERLTILVDDAKLLD